MDKFRPWQEQLRWLVADNVGIVTIPGFGLARSTGVDATTGNLQLQLPNADGQDVYVLGPQSIPPGGSGWCTRDWPTYAQYTGAMPNPGDIWGPVSGSFLLTAGKAGFRIEGGAAQGRVLVSRDPKQCCGGAVLPGKGARVIRSSVSDAIPFSPPPPNEVFTIIAYNRVIYDTGAFWNGSLYQDRFIIPSDGHYLIGANVGWITHQTDQAGSLKILIITNKLDGTPNFLQPLGVQEIPLNYSFANPIMKLETAYDLLAGSFVWLAVQQTVESAGQGTSLAGGDGLTTLWIEKLA